MAFQKIKDSAVFIDLESCSRANIMSEEQSKLADFVHRLSSYHCTSEHGVVGADERGIRQEAQLLMSLLSSTPSEIDSDSTALSTAISCTDSSGHSRTSNSSPLSRCGDVSFSFTCPSLSLENQANDSFVILDSSISQRADTHPALLLARTLKVDDRDALRLSCDAMARNVLKSFQKSIDLRIHGWIETLTKQLVSSEQEMIMAGAHTEDLKLLLNTSESILIVALRRIACSVSVSSVRTSFQVLEKVEAGERTHAPDSKSRIVGFGSIHSATSRSAIEEEDDYQYTVSYRLEFNCQVHLSTPAGFSEISVDVPGIVHGTFCSSDDSIEQICSVTVNLDTNMLAAMIDKSCRDVVRVSVQACLEENAKFTLPVSPVAAVCDSDRFLLTRNKVAEGLPIPMSHFVPENCPVSVTPNAKPSKSEERYREVNSSILMPIPDDFTMIKANVLPRRISPQPSSPDLFASKPKRMRQTIQVSPKPIQSRVSLSSTPPPFIESVGKKHSIERKHAKPTESRRLPLISPAGVESDFQEVEFGDGPFLPSFQGSMAANPSLPMLVEAAYRVMKSD